MMLLEVKGLEVRYGGIRAVKGIDLEVTRRRAGLPDRRQRRRQEHHAASAICGLLPARAGSVRYAGDDIAARAGARAAAQGAGDGARGPRHLRAAHGGGEPRHGRVRARRRGMHATGAQYETFPRLKERRPQTAGTLSGGEQQMLAIARALMATAQAAAARRAIDGPRAADGGEDLRDRARNRRAGRDDPAGRAERAPRARSRARAATSWSRAASRSPASQRRPARQSQSARSLPRRSGCLSYVISSAAGRPGW